MTQKPLQMSIRRSRLKLRLHMPTQIRLRPHQSPLIMINAHCALGILPAQWKPILDIHLLVLQIRQRYHGWCVRLLLETEFAVPGHVLDGKERAGGDYDKVEVGIGYEDSICSFDYLGENFLDRIEGVVFVVVEDGTAGAFLPVN